MLLRGERERSCRKPSSVRPQADGWSSVWDGRHRPPRATYPRLPRRPGRCGSHLAAYLVLLRLGVTVPPLLPAARWALTPPFHPYPVRGGVFSVALTVASRRPGVTWQPTRWSSDFPRRQPRERTNAATIAHDPRWYVESSPSSGSEPCGRTRAVRPTAGDPAPSRWCRRCARIRVGVPLAAARG